jgi:hypothetical protein
MIYLPSHLQEAFDRNLTDWCKGGPSAEGWTRTGEPVEEMQFSLAASRVAELDVDEVLAKNRTESQRWHIDFLKAHYFGRFDWKDTAYYQEYLRPRCDDSTAYEMVTNFISLLEDISKNGVRKPIFVTDMKEHLDFRYFRFDGCHRACALKVLGEQMAPVRIFSLQNV